MRTKKVNEIILPYKEGIPLNPSVGIGDKLIQAVELMVNNGVERIAVIRNGRPLGMIRFIDALETLGLRVHKQSRHIHY